MTIISHTHHFIYIKARKVASSTLLVTLGQHCRDPDIVTSPGDTEGLPDSSRNCRGIKTHTHPRQVMRLVTPGQWSSYTKISCVRNPWDVAVSMLLWRAYRARNGRNRFDECYSAEFLSSVESGRIDTNDAEYRRHFERICEDLHRNCDFYFDENGTPTCDVYLRYENLQADFDALCQRLGLPYTELPRLKSRSRKPEWAYRDFYDESLREEIRRIARRTIDHFGYEF